MAVCRGRILFYGLVLLMALHDSRAWLELERASCPTLDQSTSDESCDKPCSVNDDCDGLSYCCQSSCSQKQCTVVRAPCQMNGISYSHHEFMPFTKTHPDLCGDCWCQNGEKRCIEYSCSGPIP
ncbi:hypothetical protein PoB_006984600 [Plakobranchus ocellatus]|uniref:WAP domain-containing protein n=1 Tax=Plakobranchus ocellatus TaxID=259542 RepID=A0AAV4DGP7_9GAST|nr:hypothetical protein PoB_006984600 [Plakobranchus ocellatus]